MSAEIRTVAKLPRCWQCNEPRATVKPFDVDGASRRICATCRAIHRRNQSKRR